MLHDAFVKLDPEETREVLERINPVIQGIKFSPETAVAMSQALSFYPGYYFIDVAEYDSVPPLRRFIIMNKNNITALNRTNEPIYALNSKAPVWLNGENVKDYVRFFFTFVRGRHGRFLIVETVDEINWKEEPPPAARKAIGRMLSPLESAEENDDGFILKACMVFKDSLFRCDVSVRKDGTVSLMNEELLIEEMPVLDDVFGQ